MQPRKYDLFIATFSYAGNGGFKSEHPDVRDWMINTILSAKGDPRIGRVETADFADTPITMNRNYAIHKAQQKNFDLLVMVDSDMAPDMYLGTETAKPFWDSSFDFLDKHYEKGPVCVGAPYVGPPPDPVHGGKRCVYVFNWTEVSSPGFGTTGLELEMVNWDAASQKVGIEPAGALATGLILWDMRLFNVLKQPYFDYEWKSDGLRCDHCGHPIPGPRAQKASTEDVVHTRDISLAGIEALGYNPIFCNWSAWSGHWKPIRMGKPSRLHAESVGFRLREAYDANISVRAGLATVNEGGMSYADLFNVTDEQFAQSLADDIAAGSPRNGFDRFRPVVQQVREGDAAEPERERLLVLPAGEAADQEAQADQEVSEA